MILVIDVGNTNTVLGIYKDRYLIQNWRIRTERNTTGDEFNVLVSGLFQAGEINPDSIYKIVISCVVPPMVPILNEFCKKYLNLEPYWINVKTASKMPILYKNPSEVGADRIVNSVAAYNKYRCGLIVIDFGTATTFDVVSPRGEYIGGAISPGVLISAEALFLKASKLPRAEIFIPPDNVVGKDTAESLTSGIIYGYASLVDGMVERIKKETKWDSKVIATGGLASVISKVSEKIESVEPVLTLEGLRILSEK